MDTSDTFHFSILARSPYALPSTLAIHASPGPRLSFPPGKGPHINKPPFPHRNISIHLPPITSRVSRNNHLLFLTGYKS